MKKYDVITPLDICVDCILTGDDLNPEFGQIEKLFGDYLLEMGGSNCIFACQCAKLGLSTAGIGVTGKDIFGKLVLETLNQSGVDTSHIIESNDMKTGFGLSFCKPNDRAILTYLGTIDPKGLESKIMELLPQSRHLHIGSYFLMNNLRQHYIRIAEEAKRNGVTISLDTNWDPDNAWDNGLWELLSYVDILLPNENEAMAITSENNINAAVKKLCDTVGIVALKMGAKGSKVFTRDGEINFEKPFEVDVVDAIGAGDSFDAGFLYGYLNGMTLDGCLKCGSFCGSMNTRAAGGTGGQAAKTELIQYISEEKQ